MQERGGWRILLVMVLAGVLAVGAAAATLGTVVPIGGHAMDLALDEGRRQLYVANFTAGRIDIIALDQLRLARSIAVSPQPASLALSPDGRYLVVAHYGNFAAPAAPNNLLTVIELDSGGKRTLVLPSPPLGVAFGINGLALVVTTREFFLFDPVSGASRPLATIEELAATSLPAPPATLPPSIVAASVNVSGDGTKIYGLTDRFEFGYDVTTGRLAILRYVSEPEQGPRVVSVNRDGTRYLAGWILHGTALWDWATGVWSLAEFPNPAGLLALGSHAIDSDRGLVYAQVAYGQAGQQQGGRRVFGPPLLEVRRADNLALIEQLRLPENLAGKSVLSSDGSMLYGVSDSGVMAIPVGQLGRLPRVQATVEDLLFEASSCSTQVLVKQFSLVDPSGRATDFNIQVDTPGIEVTPRAGTTPATITVRVDPVAFSNQRGTTVAWLGIESAGAVNVPKPVRILVNRRDPDQRGTIVNVPGQLVDILPDPERDRFFVLRQDTNEVLVFDGSSYRLQARLPTGNRPTQMAITWDRRYLLVGHDASQLLSVFDLDTLAPVMQIRTPAGHYPRSVAASTSGILTANRVMGPVNTIDRVDLATRTVTELPTLGVYQNDIDARTVLASSPNGATILAVEADGNVWLYDATARAFTVSRQDAAQLAGAYAASSYGWYVAGDRLMNASLVTTVSFASGGQSSGFAFVDDFGFRVSALSGVGVIERVELPTGLALRATRLAEAPLLGTEEFPFTRTVAPLASRRAIVILTTSGLTVLPWEYDAAVARPVIHAVVNAADYTQPVAPGGLITLFGENLSPVNQASSQIPLPTALGDSCLTVNGQPMPILFVSPNQINAQLPFSVDGNVTLVLHTPGGVSDYYYLTILPAAPSVFRSGVAGELRNLPTIVRAKNNQLVTLSNPVHPGDDLVIYLTGMGRTSPPVEAGVPAPVDPLAWVVTQPTVTLAGEPLPVRYAGLAPGWVGVYQINVHVPWWVRPGMQQPLVITQGGYSTTLYVRVVD